MASNALASGTDSAFTAQGDPAARRVAPFAGGEHCPLTVARVTDGGSKVDGGGGDDAGRAP